MTRVQTIREMKEPRITERSSFAKFKDAVYVITVCEQNPLSKANSCFKKHKHYFIQRC